MAAIESDPVSVGNAKALVDGVKEWAIGGGASPDEADALWYVTGRRSFDTSFFTKPITLTLTGGKIACDGLGVGVNFGNDQLKGYGDLAMTVPEWARPTGEIVEARATCTLQGSSTRTSVDLDYRDGAFYLGLIGSSQIYTIKSFISLYLDYECSSQPNVTGDEPVSLAILRQCI